MPKVKHLLKSEVVVFRWKQFKAENFLAEPQPKSWNRDKLGNWIDENPIINQHDITFLTKTALAVNPGSLNSSN